MAAVISGSILSKGDCAIVKAERVNSAAKASERAMYLPSLNASMPITGPATGVGNRQNHDVGSDDSIINCVRITANGTLADVHSWTNIVTARKLKRFSFNCLKRVFDDVGKINAEAGTA